MTTYKVFKTDVSELTDDEYDDLIKKKFQDRPDSFICIDDQTILLGPEARLEDVPEEFRSLHIEYMPDQKHEKPVKWDHPTHSNTLSCPTHSTTLSCNEGSSRIYVDDSYTDQRLFQKKSGPKKRSSYRRKAI